MRNYLIILLTTISFTAYSGKGWKIITRNYNALENPLNARLEQVYLQDGYMKIVTGDLITVFDISKGELIYFNNSNQTYWKGTPERFNTEVRAELEIMIEQKLSGLEKEQQDEMRLLYNEMLNASFPESVDQQIKPRKFTVTKTGAGERISGYITETYNVNEGEIPLETIWIAPELPIAKEFDFVNLSNFLNQLARGAYAASFESSNEYFNLISKGYPVKVEMTKADGYTYITEVVKAEKIKLQTTDFLVPKGFTASTLTNVGVWNGY